MSAPAFTPAPWEAVLDGDPRGQPSIVYRGLIALVERGDRTLAVVLGEGHEYDGVPQEQWEPNARLIAAAPDLYAALNRIADDPPACAANLKKPAGQPDCDCWSCILVRDARAALAKAVAP